MESLNLNEMIASEIDGIVRLRHQLHRIPEPGFQEYETAELIFESIKDVQGITIEREIATTGILAVLGAEKQGQCIAFRADMDALPIQETNPLAYQSNRDGWMHACGHDGHAALMVGLIRVLGKCQHVLEGPVKFIFQPAEEGLGGGKKMVDAGVLKNPQVDVIFALHGWPDLKLGEVASCAGAFFASTDSFTIRIVGKGGHAAFPHHTVDPVVIAANLISSAQSIVARYVDPLDGAVISFCEVKGGNAFNIIPDEVTIRGTVRCFDSDLRIRLKEQLKQMAQGISEGYGGSADVCFHEGAYPSLICSDSATAYFFETTRAWMPEGSVLQARPTLGGEDFAYYAQEIPACMWLLGVNDSKTEEVPKLHTSKYNFNDNALSIGIQVQCELALRYYCTSLMNKPSVKS